MAVVLTEQDKERIRFHLGYMLTSFGGNQAAASLQFGIPRPAQTVFLLEEAINVLLTNEFAIQRVKDLLDTLDKLLNQIKAAACTLVAEKLGELTLHPGRTHQQYYTDLLRTEYRWWADLLADALGVPEYKYSVRFQGDNINIPVVT